MVIAEAVLRDFRSYASEELALAPGLVLVVGPNGSGKTNLLDGVHLATQGLSLRTRRDARVIRFGAQAARVRARGTRAAGRPFATEVTVREGERKRALLNGASLRSAEELRRELPVLAFTPDRLAVVKGGPLIRRTYLDRALARIAPSRADLPATYAEALAQRNAALRRVRAGLSSNAALTPWDNALAQVGTALDEARAEAVAALAPRFAAAAASLGLDEASLGYEPRGLTVEELEARLATDVERGTTGVGPHLADVVIAAAGRDLRHFGSQGEQRAAVLALLLGEAALVAETHGDAPLLLLDDVLSELDERRRAALLGGLPAGGQTLVTSTSLRALPEAAPEPALVVEVTAGRARPR